MYTLKFYRYPEEKPIGLIQYDKGFTVSGVGRTIFLRYKKKTKDANELKQIILDEVQSPYLYAQID